MHVHASSKLARLLETWHRFLEAEAALRESLLLDAHKSSLVQHSVHLRHK
jgi:hypothetical protein